MGTRGSELLHPAQSTSSPLGVAGPTRRCPGDSSSPSALPAAHGAAGLRRRRPVGRGRAGRTPRRCGTRGRAGRAGRTRDPGRSRTGPADLDLEVRAARQQARAPERAHAALARGRRVEDPGRRGPREQCLPQGHGLHAAGRRAGGAHLRRHRSRREALAQGRERPRARRDPLEGGLRRQVQPHARGRDRRRVRRRHAHDRGRDPRPGRARPAPRQGGRGPRAHAPRRAEGHLDPRGGARGSRR